MNNQINKKQMFDELINNLLNLNKSNSTKINQIKQDISKKYNFNGIIKNTQIIANCSNSKRNQIIKILNIKPIREASGVTVVALFAKPHSCPHGKCIYCPGGPNSEFGDTPQSYTGSEPAALRAIRNNYDPYLQIFNRLEHYCVNGHLPDKIELIFMGGTFPSLDKIYKDEFVNFTYKAINDFGDNFINFDEKNKKYINYDKLNDFFELKNMDLNSISRQKSIQTKILKLKQKNITNYKFEIKKAETGNLRPIGLTIETKPDWMLEKHCKESLDYGGTRFEVGVQTLNNNILKKVNRGHDINATIKSFEIAKDMCFKLNAHMMLGLPGSNNQEDKKSLINLYDDERFRPDMLKIYPCLVIKGTPLYKLFKLGKFTPIETQQAAEIIAESYKYFPRYTRVMRVQRDIPTQNIDGGVQNSNLRQYVEKEMIKLNVVSKDIREREIGLRTLKGSINSKDFKINIEKYDSSGGIDYFLDVVNELDTLIGFIRLRFPKNTNLIKEIDKKTALIRELHIYGQTISVGDSKNSKKHQHIGWGKKLLENAEQIAKQHGYTKIAIISGIGVREYYRKFDYFLEGNYMCKNI